MLFVRAALALVLAFGGAGAAQAAVSPSKAAELGVHRVARLVSLRKIEDAFVDKFYAFRVEALGAGQPNGVFYRFRAYQAQGDDGTAKQVAIFLDENGKALSHEVTDGSVGTGPAWGQKDPVTLMEMALHHVIDGASQPELAPFSRNLSEGSISQASVSPQGTVALAVFKSASTSKVLNVLLTLNGAYIRSEVK